MFCCRLKEKKYFKKLFNGNKMKETSDEQKERVPSTGAGRHVIDVCYRRTAWQISVKDI